jgi:putative redox protein
MNISLELNNDNIQFKGKTRENETILMDYFPPVGDGNGYTGLELLLMSFAGCSSTSIVYLLRKMKKTVNGLKVKAEGEQMKKSPLAFKKITIEYNITSDDVTDSDFDKVIQQSEESVSPVWAMLKGNVEIVVKHNIVKPKKVFKPNYESSRGKGLIKIYSVYPYSPGDYFPNNN